MKEKNQKVTFDFSENNRKLMIILNSLTIIFGIIAFILLFNGGVKFENPVIWIMCFLILSSISSLITIITKSK